MMKLSRENFLLLFLNLDLQNACPKNGPLLFTVKALIVAALVQVD